MQDIQTKAKKLICKLRKRLSIKKVIAPAPLDGTKKDKATKEPPKLKSKKAQKIEPVFKQLCKAEKKGRSFYKLQEEQLTQAEQSDFDFYRLQKRLDRRLKKAGIKTPEHYTTLKPKPKRGIMDNIGNIFECSYDIPAKPVRYSNSH